MSAVKAADAVGVSGQTGYNWQARWSAERFGGLVPRYAGGHPSKLTDEQKAELLETLREKDPLDDRRSAASDPVLLRCCLDHRRPRDAEKILKKTAANEQAHGALVPRRVLSANHGQY